MSELAQGGEESSGNPNPEADRLIHETQPRPGVDKTVAFLGEVGSGKTVVAALLKHTLSTKWVPFSNGRWDALVVSGHDEINEAIRSMKGGLFPSPTVKGEYPALRIDLHRMKGAPSAIGLALRDVSGHSYFERLSRSLPNGIDESLVELLQGDGSYIAHATTYVLVISCEDVDRWDADKPRAINAIKAICAIKSKMRLLDPDGRLMDPIALVFTKGDALPAELAQKPAHELAGMYPDLASTLRVTHSGPRAYFKVHVMTGDARSAQDDNRPGGHNLQQQAGSDARDPDDDGPDKGGDDEQVPAARLAVPLRYSSGAYLKIISWLVNPR